MGSWFSKQIPFDKSFGPIMRQFGLKNGDLSEDTFAQVIIGKIKSMKVKNEDKVDLLNMFLKAIYSKIGVNPPSSMNNDDGGTLNRIPKVNQEIKDLITKKKDDYKKEIFAAIAELQSNQSTPVSGGSRKKSKKSRRS